MKHILFAVKETALREIKAHLPMICCGIANSKVLMCGSIEVVCAEREGERQRDRE